MSSSRSTSDRFFPSCSIKGGKRASFGNLTQTITDNRDIQFGAKLVF
jgi:hypothetical protein